MLLGSLPWGRLGGRRGRFLLGFQWLALGKSCRNRGKDQPLWFNIHFVPPDSPDSLPTTRGQFVMPHRIPRSGQQDRSVQDGPEIPNPPHGDRFGKVPRSPRSTHNVILAILHMIRHGLDDSQYSSVVPSDLVVSRRRVGLEDGGVDVAHHTC